MPTQALRSNSSWGLNSATMTRGVEPAAAPGVSCQLVNALLRQVQAQGCDPNELLRRSDIAPHLLNVPGQRIPMHAYARLQRHAMQALGDESLGLMPGRQHLGTWAMICRSVIRCHRLDHALGRMFKHYALFDWSMACHLSVDGDECVIEIGPQDGVDFAYELRAYEMVFSVVHAFASWLIQDCVPLLSVSFVQPEPEYVDDYRHLFMCDRIQFGQPKAQLRFPSQILEAELRQDEHTLESFLSNCSLDMVEVLSQRQPWRQRLRRMLERDLHAMPEFEQVAESLGLHPQTLRRRLAVEGTTYKELKDEVRRNAAMYYVGCGGLSVEDVADRAGFSEASAFIRAFKRWTGTTPQGYKALGLTHASQRAPA